MNEPWCRAVSLRAMPARDAVQRCGRRLAIEETPRDTNDAHFDKGLSATHLHDSRRRDRLLLVKRRTHSLYRLGSSWYRCLRAVRGEGFERPIIALDRVVREPPLLSHFFAQYGPAPEGSK